MKLEITGQLIEIDETKEYGRNGFQKRQCTIKTDDQQYPQELPVVFVKDKCSVLDQFNVGDQVTVQCNLRGSQHNDRRFVEIQAWKIERQ